MPQAAIPFIALAAAQGGIALAQGAQQSRAAKSAAKTQVGASNQAMQMQYQLAQQALAAQQQANQQISALYGPQGGGRSLGALARGVGLPADDLVPAGAPTFPPGGMPALPPLPPPPGGFQLNQPGAGPSPWAPRPLGQVYGAGAGGRGY